MNKSFDKYAQKYDSWFLKNEVVLKSEVLLLAYFLKKSGRTLSVGCGSGLFEMLLRKDHGIEIQEGIEPSESMAEIARKRGLKVQIGEAETTSFGDSIFDTVIFNGSPGYIKDLRKAFENAYIALKPGSHIIVLDVPKESSYALLYNLASILNTWNDPTLEGIKPENVYPLEFVKGANWRTTNEKIEILKEVGFTNFKFAQTLTKHPLFSNEKIEQPIEGFDRGDYVAICGVKPA
jgi:ubiquinone/menaquinone biosynthesis C-methylase UbiE